MNTPPIDPGSISALLIRLKADGQPLLLIQLDQYGTLHRMGTGFDTSRSDLAIRTTPVDLLAGLRPLIGAELLGFAGRRLRDPELAGQVCELALGFRWPGGETTMEFIFGTESQGPPEPALRLVAAALAATNPWYGEF
ncbi:MAG TPA: hypothetical protein VFS21_13060 [Roseiflexaceae bacterium]|nr:hypothetical protein [Roseiflexaceae bacterium]